MPGNSRRYYSAVINSALASYALYSASELRLIKSLDDEALEAGACKNRAADHESFGLSLYHAGHTRDARRALWLAAQAGSRPAARLLGDMYNLGLGGQKNNGLAILVWARAAHQGCSSAAYNLAVYLLAGRRCVRDAARAAHTFLVIANATDCPDSMYAFAYCARNGLGTQRNQRLALAMYRRGARLGCPDCQFMAGFFCERGIVEPRNVPRAILWYSLAARGGDRQALLELHGLWAQIINGHVPRACQPTTAEPVC